MVTPLVSVLLPLYNEPIDFAIKAIDSIINQSYRNLEIILLLDNPENLELRSLITDYTHKDNRVVVHINTKNLGLPETLNTGIDLARGEYIARMDGDDISDLYRFEIQIDFLLNHHDVDLLGSNAHIIDEKENIIGEYTNLSSDTCQKIMLRYSSINLIHPTWIGKASLFRSVKYRNIKCIEDYDFMLRAYFCNAKFANLPNPLLRYRIAQNIPLSISRKNAYIQYANTIEARRQYNIARKTGVYPDFPTIEYTTDDIKKFQEVNYLVNNLRTYVSTKQYFKSIKNIFSIWKIDRRPVISRLKNNILKILLHLVDKCL